MKSLSKLAMLLLFASLPRALPAQDALLAWLNRVRAEAGLPPCRADSRLERAAADYAGLLASRGRLAHRDGGGRNALDRYREAGGSAVLVGEVLAAAGSAEEAEQAWLNSAGHRELLLAPGWSHAGAGCSSWEDLTVYVLLVCVQRVENLTLSAVEGGYLLSGCFPPGLGARRPLLWAGIGMPAPELWDPGAGCFRFRLSAAAEELYCRLGYLGPDEAVVVTDAFIPRRLATSPPGRAPR